jgi:hypothetical protein
MKSRGGGGVIKGLVLTFFLHSSGFASAAPAVCIGDCNNDGQVTVDELITGVNIALGDLEVAQCPVFDGNEDLEVDVSEIVTAVNLALDGCPAEAVWSGWSEVPGGFATEVAPAATAFSELYLLAKGASDDRLYINVLSEGSWVGWSPLPADVTTDVAPAASVKPPGGTQTLPLLLVYARGGDGQIQFNRAFLTATGTPTFNLWMPIAGLRTDGPPAAAFEPCGTLQTRVFAVDGERVLFNIYNTEEGRGEYPGAWQAWTDTQTSSLTPVAALEDACSGPGTFSLSVFGSGSTRIPFASELIPPDFTGSASDVPPVDFQTDTGLAAAFCGQGILGNDEICLLANGVADPNSPQPYEDSAIYLNRYRRADESWSGWTLIPGGLTTDQPVAAVHHDGGLYVFAKPKDEDRIVVNSLRP